MATAEGLVISNTHFGKPNAKRTTHTGPNGNERQIDFILMDKRLWKWIRDAGSSMYPDLGSDHKGVKSRMLFASTTMVPKRNEKRPKKGNECTVGSWSIPQTIFKTYSAR